jgi:hypothetical protein
MDIMNKVNVSREAFLRWYFDDSQDYELIGVQVVKNLMETGRFEIDIESLFENCSQIPGFITDGDEDADYDTDQVNLIN